MSKISDKLNCSNLFCGALFVRSQCTLGYNTHKAGKLHTQITQKTDKNNTRVRKK